MSKRSPMVETLRNVLTAFEENGMSDDEILVHLAKVVSVVKEGRARHAALVSGITVGAAMH